MSVMLTVIATIASWLIIMALAVTTAAGLVCSFINDRNRKEV